VTRPVSVIVPNYNHARFLPKRIESILRQTFQDFELILLDDCSNDNSRSVLSQYARDPRTRIEFNEVNSGSTFKQWNKGIRLAIGKYVWIAESDDYADENFLGRLVATLDQDPAITFVYCRSWRVTENDQTDGYGDWHLDSLNHSLWKTDFCADGREQCRMYFVRSPVVSNASAAVFRKAAYESAGGADETLRLCGDWKLWAALALAGKVAYVSEPLNYFRYHTSTVRTKTSRDAADVLEKLQVIRWILERAGPTKSDLQNARREAAKFWVPAVISMRTSLGLKGAILEKVRTIDPHPIPRALRPALVTVRRKFMRHWRSLRSKSSPFA
jgi:glycosyltransferase involved in cell wall biosynthesis